MELTELEISKKTEFACQEIINKYSITDEMKMREFQYFEPIGNFEGKVSAGYSKFSISIDIKELPKDIENSIILIGLNHFDKNSIKGILMKAQLMKKNVSLKELDNFSHDTEYCNYQKEELKHITISYLIYDEC